MAPPRTSKPCGKCHRHCVQPDQRCSPPMQAATSQHPHEFSQFQCICQQRVLVHRQWTNKPPPSWSVQAKRSSRQRQWECICSTWISRPSHADNQYALRCLGTPVLDGASARPKPPCAFKVLLCRARIRGKQFSPTTNRYECVRMFFV